MAQSADGAPPVVPGPTRRPDQAGPPGDGTRPARTRAPVPADLAGAVLDGLPRALGVVDAGHRFLWLNAELARMNGPDVTAHLGRRVREIVPDLWPRLAPVYRQVTETGEPVLDVEVTGLTPASPAAVSHYSASYFPLTLPSGERATGILVLDVTAARAAEAERDRFASVVRTCDDFVAIADLQGRVLFLNPAGRALVGVPDEVDVAGTGITDYLTERGCVTRAEVERPAVLGHGRWHGTSTLRDWRGGEPIDVEVDSWLLRDARTDEPMALCTIQRDIRARLRHEAQVRRRVDEQQAIASLCQRALSVQDEAELLLEATRVVAAALPATRVDVYDVAEDGTPTLVARTDGSPPAGVDPAVPVPGDRLAAAAARAVASGPPAARSGPGRGVVPAGHVDAVVVPTRHRPRVALATYTPASDPAGSDGSTFLESVAAVVGAASDRLAAESTLRRQALHDSLTGLPNRALILDRLDQALARTLREPGRVAVMLLDVDDFKLVNDSFGHETGDALLVGLGAALRATLRPEDTVARLGGDEFLILCEHLPDEAAALVLARRLREAWAEPFALAVDARLRMSACLGIALSLPGSTAPSLLREADAAMYRGKARGHDQVEVFDQRMQSAALRRLELERDLRAALEEDALEVHYQPVVELDGERVVGYEALARWTHPRLGPVGPAEFVPIAEETHLVDALGRRVQQRVLDDLRRRRRLTGGTPHVSVNVSPVELRRAGYATELTTEMRRHGVPAGSLGLDVPAGVLLDAAGRLHDSLAGLADAGLGVLLDDFGTGSFSLGNLHRLPVSALKIDGSIVAGLPAVPHARATVEAVVALARAFGLTTVAEGVETAEQAAALRALGCSRAQGHLFGSPRPWREQLPPREPVP